MEIVNQRIIFQKFSNHFNSCFLLIVVVKVLHMMVGRNISDEQLGGIADRAISDADLDKDGVISFDELKRVRECLVIVQ